MASHFTPFVEGAPLCAMSRVALENLFDPKRLNDLFQEKANWQYQREVLFSEVIELMLSVVLRVKPSVHAAYQAQKGRLKVSDQAVYDKLQRMELGISSELVVDSARYLSPTIKKLKTGFTSWIPGYRAKVLDGCHLAATQGRIRELRKTIAAALPGTVLAVYEQETDLVTDVFLTQDGHAQERSLLDDVLDSVKPGDLWIADRNFCTTDFMIGINSRLANFAIRQHGALKGKLLGESMDCGATEAGKVSEQELRLPIGKEEMVVRRISLVMKEATRDGETEIHILTNLPTEVDAAKIAEVYRHRWSIENRFYEVTQTMNCEPNTLGYPKAALLAFCLALVASNAVALIRATLRSVHPEAEVSEMSSYHMANEIRETMPGMMIALPSEKWEDYRHLNPDKLAEVLSFIAKNVKIEKYKKAVRGPKKPPTPKEKYKKGEHLSTYKLIKKRRP